MGANRTFRSPRCTARTLLRQKHSLAWDSLNPLDNRVAANRPVPKEDVINGFNTARYTHRKWAASLDLRLQRCGNRTILAHSQHQGPLRLQRPFFPEGPGLPHLYLLHPPGGLAPGDWLKTQVHCENGAEALVTTPSANRVYCTDTHGHGQTQISELRADADACIEWLPQETLVFDNAKAQLQLKIEAQMSARFFAWELLVLGRTGSDAPFERGTCQQRIEVLLDGLPVLSECTHLEGGSQLMASPWGLDGGTVAGIWVCHGIPCQDHRHWLSRLREAAADTLARTPEATRDLHIAFTRKDSLLIGRIIGNDSEAVRNLFIHCWEILRPALNGRPAIPPRIWAT